jgi:hypothetical protein
MIAQKNNTLGRQKIPNRKQTAPTRKKNNDKQELNKIQNFCSLKNK